MTTMRVSAGLFGLSLVVASLVGGTAGFVLLGAGAVVSCIGVVGPGRANKAAAIAGIALALYLFSRMRP